MTSFSAALYHSLPEVVLALSILGILLYGALRDRPTDGLATELAIAALALAGFFVVFGQTMNGLAYADGFVNDGMGRFMKILILIGSIGTLAMSQDYLRRAKMDKFEFPILVLLATLGMFMLASANDLIALYLGLETMSLALYVLAAFNRDSVKATEAGLKYFVLGALSSGMLLYGASLIYGTAGAVNFASIAAAAKAHPSLGLTFGLAFVMAGAAFKISAAPFHMWTPDVYEGAPTPVTTFFATSAKVAAMAMLLRLVYVALPGIVDQWRQIVGFLAIASMALGSIAAIGQRNIKRLMAYSSIGHMGFALVGVAAGTAAGMQGVMIYMAIYVLMTLGVFAAIIQMRRGEGQVEDIYELAGLARHDRGMAFLFAMLMFSLAGIPPLAGFFAKWYVFSAAVDAKLYGLAVVGVLLSVISAFYYLRIVKIMYFDEPAEAFAPRTPSALWVFVITSALVLLFSFWPGGLDKAALAAAKSFF